MILFFFIAGIQKTSQGKQRKGETEKTANGMFIGYDNNYDHSLQSRR